MTDRRTGFDIQSSQDCGNSHKRAAVSGRHEDMSINVLLVEDNFADVVLFEEAVAEVGLDYLIARASDGAEAVELLEAVRRGERGLPDLIILDLNLPRVDGRRLVEMIRRDPGLASAPLVILTSSATDHDVALMHGYPLESYFVKPPTFAGLKTVVTRIDDYRQRCLAGA